MILKQLIALGAVSILSGCSILSTTYTTPAFDVSNKWHTTQPHGGSVESLTQWWSQFNDPILTHLIEVSESQNQNILVAVERINQSRALADINRSQYLPKISANYSDTSSQLQGSDVPKTITKSAQLSMSWELDLFGKIRNSQDAAESRYASTKASWHDARISLAADVASAYTQRRQCELLSRYQEADIESRRSTIQIMQAKHKAGFTSTSELERLEAGLIDSESNLESTQANCKLVAHQLSLLTGLDIERVLEHLNSSTTALIPVPTEKTIVPIPAVVLSQRPDIKASELNLRAAYSDLNVAKISNLPVVQLTGFIGSTILAAGGLTSKFAPWQLVGSANMPLFEGGAGIARVDSAMAKYKEAEHAYRYKVQTAIKEVEDSLVKVHSARNRIINASQSLTKYRNYHTAVQAKYHVGMSSLLEMEDANRVLLNAEQSKTIAQADFSSAWISLYKALGGGWKDEN